jgi:hypothetical protein
MGNWAPKITSVGFEQDGGQDFRESQPPDDVYVELGTQVKDLEADDRSIVIAREDLKPFEGHALAINVGFKWVGPPDEVRWSGVVVGIPGGASAPVSPDPAKPVVQIRLEPATLTHPNRATVSWSSFSYTDGNILWGPHGSPREHKHSFEPRGTTYRGAWTTDIPLAPRALYSFTVQVRDSLTTKRWIETTVEMESAANHHSVRSFLAASGISGQPLRKALGAQGASFRRAMGI